VNAGTAKQSLKGGWGSSRSSEHGVGHGLDPSMDWIGLDWVRIL